MNFKYLGLTVAVAGGIFCLSAIPSLSISEHGLLDQVLRKSGHIFVFGVLSFFLWQSLPGLDHRPFLKLLLCAALVVGFAVSDEFHQHFVPGRRGNLHGFAFDVAGIVPVLSFLYLRLRKTPSKPVATISDSPTG